VITKPGGEEIFRAQRIAQRVADDGNAWFTDLEHPERGESLVPAVIAGGTSALLTGSRSYHPEDFGYAVEALTAIFRASVEIGSPVRWT
jgi:hypothetical protein